jgi:hypothetical protein
MKKSKVLEQHDFVLWNGRYEKRASRRECSSHAIASAARASAVALEYAGDRAFRDVRGLLQSVRSA